MIKLSFLAVLFIICNTLVAEETKKEEFFQKSQDSIFESKLVCDEPLDVGSFQSCRLELLHESKPIQEAEVYIDGGMPEHAHGLPTSPKAVWITATNSYEIQGLKFSMPGKWLLKFRVKAEAMQLTDQINFSIDID